MAAEDELSLEVNDSPSAPLRFKVITTDGFSATTTLDAAWQAKSFMQAVVKPVVLKLNKRADKEPVAADLLERIEIDGVEVADDDVDLKTASVSSIVPAGTSQLLLSFGLAPPKELRFAVDAAGGDTSFTITLDAKFMHKSFHDAVLVPFVKYYNKRVHLPVEASGCVQVHIDGQKLAGSIGSLMHKKTALQLLGRAPAHATLFFSWDAVSQAERQAKSKDGGGYSRLHFKVPIHTAAEVVKEDVLNYDHSELTPADGVDLGAKLLEYGPLDKLKHVYLESNGLGDAGCGAIGRAVNRKNTKNLRRLVLSHNKIGSAGVVQLVAMWSGESRNDPTPKELKLTDDERRSPPLDLLDLADNRIGDEGANALCDAAESGALKCREVRLHNNGAITPAARARLTAPAVGRQGMGVLFRFDAAAIQKSVFDHEGNVVPECDIRGSNLK